MFHAVIETDGTLSHLTLIQQVTPAPEAAAADAVRQWRYKPAACGSTPFRVETAIAVDFHLRYWLKFLTCLNCISWPCHRH